MGQLPGDTLLPTTCPWKPVPPAHGPSAHTSACWWPPQSWAHGETVLITSPAGCPERVTPSPSDPSPGSPFHRGRGGQDSSPTARSQRQGTGPVWAPGHSTGLIRAALHLWGSPGGPRGATRAGRGGGVGQQVVLPARGEEGGTLPRLWAPRYPLPTCPSCAGPETPPQLCCPAACPPDPRGRELH